MVEIINKDDIPSQRPANKTIREILEALKGLESTKAIQYECRDGKKVNSLRSTLEYYQNRKHRPGKAMFPNMKMCQRGNALFVWLDGEGTST